MNIGRTIQLILICSFTLQCSALSAQGNNPKFETIPLDVSTYFGFVHFKADSQGYLWISSANGLFKYNGYTATKFIYEPFDPNSLSQNLIYTCWIDSKDTIWIGTPEGLCKFDRVSEKFIRYDTLMFPDMPNLGNVSAIGGDDQGNIWIGNFVGEFWHYNINTGKFRSLTDELWKDSRPLDSVFHDEIHFIFIDKVGGIWLGTNNGVHQLIISRGKTSEPEKFSFIHYRHDPLNINSLSGNDVRDMIQDHAGVYWIAGIEGLSSFDLKTQKFARFKIQKDGSPSEAVKNINSILEDPDHNIWLGTDFGLYKLNEARSSFSVWHENPNDEFGLKSDYINSLGLDAGGTLFLNTNNGIQSYFLHQKSFNLLENDRKNMGFSRTIIGSNSNVSVTALAGGVDDNVWIGTFGSGLEKWDRASGKISNFQNDPKKGGSLKNNYVSALMQDPNGDLWIGTTGFLSRLKNGTDLFEHFNSEPRKIIKIDALNIYSLGKDREGLIWLGTGNGIKSFNPVTKQFRHYYYEKNKPFGISDYTALAILVDSKDNIWVGMGSIAFNRFDKKTERFIQYKNNPLDSTSISSNLVNCVYEDSKGNLWIGTFGGGLCQYNYASDNFITHTRNKVLPWNTVFSIQEDNAGNIWIGTENGLSCYFTNQKQFVTYDIHDGLQDKMFGAGYRFKGSSLKDKDGIMYFGGISGLNYFDPAQIHSNTYVPPIVITQFKVFDKLQPGENEAKEITLNYNQNFFSFEFAALNFTNTNNNNYAYQLEGVDPGWINSGTRRYAGYTGVSPGKYVFKAKGSNNDGVWNEKGISVVITVLPPWWRTWWAYTFYGLMAMAGILSVDRIQRRRVIEKQRQISREKELAQAKEIEKAYHQLKETQTQLIHAEKMASLGELTAGIAHEIQNPLNFVNNFSDVNTELIDEVSKAIRQNNPDEAQNILISLKDNEEKIKHHGQRADAIVKSMLQHSRTSKGQKEKVNLNAMADEYLRLAYHGFRYKDKNFNATMQTEYDERLTEVNIVPQDIGRVLLNLYNNAFYAISAKSIGNTEYKAAITVTTRLLNNSPQKNEKSVIISVKDNGPGIPEKIREKIFQPFFTTKPTGEGTGLGLSMSYDIIKAHGGSFKVESKENEGSEFIVELPLS